MANGGWSYSAKNDEEMIKTYQTTVKTSKTINYENDKMRSQTAKNYP